MITICTMMHVPLKTNTNHNETNISLTPSHNLDIKRRKYVCRTALINSDSCISTENYF